MCTKRDKDEIRVTQGISRCGVGDPGELPRMARIPLMVPMARCKPLSTKGTYHVARASFLVGGTFMAITTALG